MNTITFAELGAFAASLVEVDVERYATVVGDEETARPLTPVPGTVPTTAPASESVGPLPPPTSPVASTVPPAAPAGRVLVANASTIGGIGAQESATLQRQGLDVLEPTNAVVPGGEALPGSRLFARPGFEALGEWLANEYSVDAVEPFDALEEFVIDGGVDDAGVVLVLGLDTAAATIGGGDLATAPLVIGDNVTLGAASALSVRGYLVNAEVNRQLTDLVAWIGDVVEAVDPDVLVIQLGTNGQFEPSDFDALLDAVSDVPNVIIVNVHADRSWAATNNALIADRDHPGDNVIVLDWNALAQECPGACFADDGIHLTAIGSVYFAHRLGDITGY